MTCWKGRLKMLKVKLMTFDKLMILLDEIIGGLATVAALFTAVIVGVAFWMLYQPHIQIALRAAQQVMFGG